MRNPGPGSVRRRNDYGSPKPPALNEEIRRDLWEKRTLVKTSCMRQTLHLIPAGDFSIYINALKDSRTVALLNILGKFGMGRKEYEALTRNVKAAAGSNPVPGQELTQQIKQSPEHYKKVYRDQGWWISPVILLGGRIIGVWSSKISGTENRIKVTIEPFEPFSDGLQRDVARETEKLSLFLHASLDLEYI